jgi:PAS domain S-box-containing protein
MSIDPPPSLPPGLELGSLLDSLAAGVALFTPDGLACLANAAFVELYGAAVPLGAAATELFGDDSPFGKAVAQALEGNPVHQRELQHQRAPGDSIWLRLDGRPLTGNDGHRIGALLTCDEITELKRAEREMWQIEKMSALGRLAASVAHEVRNPLGAIDIQLQLLQEDLDPIDEPLRQKAMRRLHVGRVEMRRLDGIVQNFLRFSRPPKLHLSSVNPNDMLRHIFALLEPEAREQDIELVLELDESLPPLEADENLLSQALLNVLINAFQAVEQQSRVVLTSRRDDGARQIELRISDNGHGIAPETLERIFEFYYTTKDEGTGLGLSIAERIVHQHGGTLSVESQTGKGTDVIVRLPA